MGKRGYFDHPDDGECNQNTRAEKMDIVIVDPSRRDRCVSSSGPSLVERAWIMTRPPGELVLDKRLVTARKLLAVREKINCWSGEYNDETMSFPTRPVTLDMPISNCNSSRRTHDFCMVHSVENCPAQTPKRQTCIWTP